MESLLNTIGDWPEGSIVHSQHTEIVYPAGTVSDAVTPQFEAGPKFKLPEEMTVEHVCCLIWQDNTGQSVCLVWVKMSWYELAMVVTEPDESNGKVAGGIVKTVLKTKDVEQSRAA